MKIRNFTLLALAVFLSAAVFVFAQNGQPLKYTSKVVPERTMKLGEMQQAKPAPEGLVKALAAKTNRAQAHRAGSAVDLAGDYTWAFEQADSYSDATAERTSGSAKVTITASGEGYTISGMFPNDLSATIDEYGYLVVDGSNAGSSSYGDYDVRGLFYYEGDDTYEAGWYFTDIYAVIGEDGVISFDNVTWLIRLLTTGDYAGYTLYPYWAPGSTLTPAAPVDEVVFSDDFESGDLSGWTLYTQGEGDGWVPATPADYDIGNAHSGIYCASSWSWNSAAINADNYLVSPKVALGGSVEFWAMTNGGYPDSYEVLLSTTGNAVADFNITLRAMAPAEGNKEWIQVNLDLSAYAGKEGYIAIHHKDYDNNYLFIDDFAVYGAGAADAGFALEFISDHGFVTFTVDGKEVTKAEAGKTVTATVTPNENFIVDDVVAHAFTEWSDAQAPQRIGLYKDVELTAAGENTWTFTMPEASVEFLVSYMKNVQLSVESGDITAALEAAAEGLPVNDLELTLKSGSEYTISNSMTAGGNIVVNGNGAKVDASALENAFIVLEGTKEFAQKADGTDSDHKYISNVVVKGLTLTGMKNSFITDAQKTLLEILVVNDCNIEMPASNKNFIDFNGKGYVGLVWVTNSTIWAKDMNTGFFAQYGSRPKNVNGDWLQQFAIQNSTIVNIANGKNMCDLKQNGTAQNVYILSENIFVNCGKNGQTVVGFNKGQTSATPVWDVTGNTFIWGGESTNEAEIAKAGQKDGEDIVKDCVDGDPGFADAANGDFTLNESSEQRKFRVGDPRWFTDRYVPAAVTAAIDVNVPSTLGVMDGEVGPTDLYYFVEDYMKDSENPAYIKLALEAGAKYVISRPLTVITAIEIVGDAENPATIDASELGANPFVQINNDWAPVEGPNEKGFYNNVYNVSFKNFNLTGLKGQVFYANKQKYLIPYLTVENCQFRMEGATNKTFFDFNGGGFVENLTIKNSTLSADDATKWSNGGFFSTQSGTKLDDCGAQQLSFVLTNNTFYNVAKGKTLSTLRESSKKWLSFEVLNNIVVNSGKKGQFVKGLNAGNDNATPSWLVNYNSFQWTDDNKVFEDVIESEVSGASKCGISGLIEGVIAFKYAVTDEEPDADILLGNYTLDDCAQKTAQIGDPRWLKDNPTGIQTMTAETQTEGAWYTIQGVRVAQPTKGIFIHNGKKVVVK